jgi:hypothetical protein
MKTLIQLILFTSLLLLLQAVSCKSPDDKKLDCNNNTMQLPQMAKDYFLFKDGSYWVYKNTITQQQDFFYVSDFKNLTGDNSQYKYGNKLKRCYEFYSYKLSTTIGITIGIGILPSFPNNDLSFQNQPFFINETNSITGQLYPKAEFVGDSLYRTNYVLDGIVMIIDTIEIDTQTFNNVLYFNNPNGGINYVTDSYYAKNIGLIKFTTNDNQTYELIKYHINQ